jgi:endonuclease/exonuclease/phosphatase family metal-dependent hydrolase
LVPIFNPDSRVRYIKGWGESFQVQRAGGARGRARLHRAFSIGVIASLALGVVLPALAVDTPVRGRRLSLRSSHVEPARRSATIVLRDSAIAAPFPDPRDGAALIVSGGAATGQCRVEVALDPLQWQPIEGDGVQRGYRYRDDGAASRGIRRIVLRPGEITVRGRGAEWPCALAATQRAPVTVELRSSGARYCAGFGGSIEVNDRGRFLAFDAPAPAGCAKTDVTVANLNILHGIFCGRSSGYCRLDERMALLFQWLVQAGCPDLVTFQEVFAPAATIIRTHAATACPFAYEEVYMRTSLGTDDQMILSRFPVAAKHTQPLYRGFRSVTFARIDHPVGPVDVFSTHLASSSDGAQNPCDPVNCPPECAAAGMLNVRQCQGLQMANYVAARHDVPGPAVITGDFNESPDTFVYHQFTGRGWVDTYLAAGNPECDPSTGVGCTSGREDEALTHLESPASNENERIDYIFLVPPAPPSLCPAMIDSSGDADGDGTATRIFAGDPNPFAPACGAAPLPICWPSDHEGMELDLECAAGTPSAGGLVQWLASGLRPAAVRRVRSALRRSGQLRMKLDS